MSKAGSPTTRRKRFEAYGWQVIPTSTAMIRRPSTPPSKAQGRPTADLICCKTVIGLGFAQQGRHPRRAWRAAGRRRDRRRARPHGLEPRPLRDSRRCLCRLGREGQGRRAEGDWNAKFAAYAKAFPTEAAEFKRRMAGELPAGWAEHAKKAIDGANAKAETVATRKASQIAINALARRCPNSSAARPT
jgi:transketolase